MCRVARSRCCAPPRVPRHTTALLLDLGALLCAGQAAALSFRAHETKARDTLRLCARRAAFRPHPPLTLSLRPCAPTPPTHARQGVDPDVAPLSEAQRKLLGLRPTAGTWRPPLPSPSAPRPADTTVRRRQARTHAPAHTTALHTTRLHHSASNARRATLSLSCVRSRSRRLFPARARRPALMAPCRRSRRCWRAARTRCWPRPAPQQPPRAFPRQGCVPPARRMPECAYFLGLSC
jgi:hypothetical protein